MLQMSLQPETFKSIYLIFIFKYKNLVGIKRDYSQKYSISF